MLSASNRWEGWGSQAFPVTQEEEETRSYQFYAMIKPLYVLKSGLPILTHHQIPVFAKHTLLTGSLTLLEMLSSVRKAAEQPILKTIQRKGKDWEKG